MTRRRLVVEADGGSRGNPGVAGYGALVRDAGSGSVLARRAAPLGHASNNVAEYSGLLAGLRAAQQVEPGPDVEVRMDSKLVVEQMSGRWKVRHEDMRRLAAEAAGVVAQITAAGGSVRYQWVPRSQNKAADELSNIGMDGTTVSEGPSPRDESTGEGGGLELPRGLRGSVPAPQSPGEAPPEPTDVVLDPGGRVTAGHPPTGDDGTVRIVLVRHGVTDFTVTGKLDGRGGADPDLNALGRSQAAAAGEAVRRYLAGRPARVVTSDLARARQTGAAVAQALGVQAVADRDWDEQGFGEWDGSTFGSLVARHSAELLAMRDDPDFTPPGGESHADLVRRVVPAFERAVAAGGTTVVASHRKPLLVVLAHVLGVPFERFWRLATAPASVSCVEVSDGPGGAAPSLVFLNDTAHLRDLPSPPGTLGT